MFDYYSASGIVLLTFCFFEVIAISYVYGLDRWCKNVEDMIQRKVNLWIKICWAVVTPVMTAVSIVLLLNTLPVNKH